MMSKKAMNVSDFLYWIVSMLFVVLMLVSVFFIVRIYESKETDTAEIESAIFKHYLLYSPNGLSYYDFISDRLYVGIIDPDNFDSARLEAAANFGDPNNMVAANITLFDLNTDLNTKTVVNQTYYNEKKYLEWLPLAFSTFLGRGAVFKAENETYVVYIDENNQTKAGLLKTIILVPRT